MTQHGLTLEERFLMKVDKSDPDGCWRWLGKIDKRGRGYGQFSWKLPDGRVKSVGAHRFAYELWVGPIPPGYDIDHVVANGCEHTDCVRAPGHLEAVTEAENTRRYLASLTHCRKGHSYAEFGYPGTTGMRCRQCDRERVARHWRRNHPVVGGEPKPLKTHCVNNHEFTPENTKMGGKLGTTRLCIQCGRDTRARYEARKRQDRTSSPS
jgi:hypothetical protein